MPFDETYVRTVTQQLPFEFPVDTEEYGTMEPTDNTTTSSHGRGSSGAAYFESMCVS